MARRSLTIRIVWGTAGRALPHNLVEAALGKVEALRRRSRSTTGHLRNAGYTEFAPQLGLRVDRDLQRRLEGLAQRYAKVLHPILG